MRWRQGRRSDNVVDQRGAGPARRMRIGGRGGFGVIIIALIAMYFGADPQDVMRLIGGNGGQPAGQQAGLNAPPQQTTAAEEELADMVKVVLAYTEDVWHEQFRAHGRTYEEPKLNLFRDQVESACGLASSAVGPFYCPGDHEVYIDLSFYEQLKTRHGAPGDFAQAYVIAHEVGHHIQSLLGISEDVRRRKAGVSEAAGNRLSVRQELQADYLAGVWAHHAQKKFKFLERGDIKEALNAATAIGDDRLQMEARGQVRPDSFTHGTSEQRVRWFAAGFKSGDFAGMNAVFELPYEEL